MKTMTKKLGAVVLALAMCFSLCCTALVSADDEPVEYTITVDNSVAGSTYHAYKIFDATYDGNGNVAYTIKESDAWYNVVSAATTVFTLTPVYVAGSTTVVDYYYVKVNDDVSEESIIAVFEDAIEIKDGAAVWKDSGNTISSAATGTGDGGSIKLNVTNSGAGYYFVSTSTGSVVSLTTAAPEVTVIDKNVPISMEKEMVHKNDKGEIVDRDTAESDGMGEEIDFDITAQVPMYEGKNYVTKYTFTDTLTNGLLIELTDNQFYLDEVTDTYYLSVDTINSWITLKDGEGNKVGNFTDYVYNYTFELVGYNVYTDEITGNDVYTFSGFVLTYYTFDYKTFYSAYEEALEKWIEEDPENHNEANFDFYIEDYYKNSVYPANASIEIEYTAHVSSLEGYENTNDIVMEHEVTPWGHPYKPTPGEKIEKEDYVYSWELKLLKVSNDETPIPLEGATFTLECSDMKDAVVGHSYLYVLVSVLDESGGVYQYGDESYAVVDFESTDYYYDKDSGEYVVEETDDGPYHRILTDKVTVGENTTTYSVQGTTDGTGNLYFGGLGIGTYTLTEITAPEGYNLLKDPIVFTIDWDEENGFTVSYASGSTGPDSFNDGYILEMTIVDNAGTELPSTGGIGTTIFYIIGGVLVAGAVVVLVTRRRMTREN